MKIFHCQCGQPVFFDNNTCLYCGRVLGYAMQQARMVTLEPAAELWRDVDTGDLYRFCGNRQQDDVCNGIVSSGSEENFCTACRLNHTIPDLSNPENLNRWRRIEQAKRRLIYGLLSLDLPLTAPVAGFPRGLSFNFLEDQRTNPNVPEEFINTGHRDGVITINVLEADDVERARQREQSAERYRTVLGHFRHEAGHYYYELLVGRMVDFDELFGDPEQPYIEALKDHYDHGPQSGWQRNYISAYASSHPLEDWAECFAHYLHSLDTVETAVAREVIPPLSKPGDIESILRCWEDLAVTLNELNRSLGLSDAYPFVVTPLVANKLRFVHESVRRWSARAV